jgi:hypothetical protein
MVTVLAIISVVVWFDLRCLADLARTSDRQLRHFNRFAPGTAPARWTPRPATRHGIGCRAPATGASTGCCTSRPLSNSATTPKAAATIDAKLTAGKTPTEAIRCLKRRLSDLVYRQMLNDAERPVTGPGGQRGASLQSSAADPIPTVNSSEKSLPGPARTQARTSADAGY